ncbi:glycosyltransferase family 4 protein [Microbacterium sp. LMC-P-041]|uniref:glycosyltransferase family 4 protein n=1 Tax=Microbacterium sp. LMC-P-041 TaxID=3040293 RepID=UPI00255746D2|nr:glycosyltransferase family 4 protein [Microbacterium sp. LMC-P-041]
MSGKIHVFPAWAQNPYLNMLYVGARSEGWRVEGSKTIETLVDALPGLTDGDIFHIHWTSPIVNSDGTRDIAERSLKRFAGILLRLRKAGVRIIWTVHNTLAHNTPYPDLEVKLARLLAERADRIIQLNASTSEAVSEFYDLPPEKIVTLRHASYAGIYSDPPSQDQARELLGIPSSASVVGFVGQIRGYKGIPTLLRAVGKASSHVDDLVLVLAGKTAPEDIALIERELPTGVPTVRRHSFISDANISAWFAACDVLVFPYERVLNSGSVLLSATFARPCILPAEPHLIAEYGAQPWVTFYDTRRDPVSALADTIAAAFPVREDVRAAATRFASEYSTLHMAWDYVSIIEDLTDSSTQTTEVP